MIRYGRFWSIAAVISLLATTPVYGNVPVVDPPPTQRQGALEAGSKEGPGSGGGIPQGPGAGDSQGPSGDVKGSAETAQEPTGNTAGNSKTAGAANGGPGGEADSQDKPALSVQEPVVAAQGAVLMDAATGELLFSKNGNKRYYPASITKLMTALLTAEKCSLDDTVTFSKAATTNLESGAVTLNLTEGDKLTVRQCLYGLLLKSANEVANGLAEHMSGSVAGFAKLMNQRARELGCLDTNFVNPNGLNNENHYTTPYDMALIGRAALENQVVQKAASTLSYEIPATKKAGARTISLGHKMLYPNDSRYYPGVVGGKTGYTSLAGNTLVTYAEQDGVRLVAVIMKSKTTQYTDTKALFDYGFALKSSASGPLAESSQNSASAESDRKAGWAQEGGRWYYVKEDKSRAANEWLTIEGKEYWFDSDSYMAAGWRQFSNNAWYYFHSTGAMASSCWVQNRGKWFYLGENGAMLTNTTTPDGYRVDENGICQEG